jgi:putative DNA primase/helicase
VNNKVPFDLIAAINALADPEPPTPHERLLDALLDELQPLDFEHICNVEEGKSPTRAEYYILVIQEITRLATAKDWGLRQYLGACYLYNGAWWKQLENSELSLFFGRAAGLLGVPWKLADCHKFRKELVAQFFEVNALPKVEPPAGRVLVNLQNGTLEITPSGHELREFRAGDFLTYQLPFAYEPTATAPIFARYLARVLPDIASQRVLAEYIGYVFLHNETLKLEKVLLLYGTGANGKSVFYEVVRALLGRENVTESPLSSLTNENGYSRAMLANKLLNYCSEINGRLEAGLFKQLASGEPVEARLPYGKPQTINNYARLIFNANELPSEVENTAAFFRRFLIIPFTETISPEERDPELAAKIIATELSGVLNWVLLGLDRLLLQRGFSPCPAADAALARYEVDSDSVKQFVAETELAPHPEHRLLLKDVYAAYCNYCKDNGLRPVGNPKFGKRLEGSGFETGRVSLGRVVYAKGKGDL